MALKQLNRFCGFLNKSREIDSFPSHPSLSFTRRISKKMCVYSSVESTGDFVFDGLIYDPEVNHFDRSRVSSYTGNWAFAQVREDELYLTRDRLGVRAIYYYEDDSYFCFANELKSLLGLPFVNFEVSSSAAFRFLFLNQNDVLEDNLFKGIKELRPGCRLTYNLISHEVYEEFEYQYASPSRIITDEDEASFLISTAINKSVAKLTSLSNVGSLLSGGIDSSVIASAVAIIERQEKMPFITAFSNDESVDELPFAEAVVRRLELQNWNQIQASNIEKEVESMHLAMDLPTFSAGSYLQYELMRFAGFRGIEVLLDGTGADALFAGHNYYRAVNWNALLRKGRMKSLMSEVSTYQDGFWLKYYLKNIIKYHYLPKSKPKTRYRMALRNNPLLAMLEPDLINENDELLNIRTAHEIEDLNKFLEQEFFSGSVRKLLRFPDRFGKYFGVMNASVYAESPDIIDAAFSIDSSLKIKNGQLKYLLRHAYRAYLPEEVLNRRDKKGLLAPNNRWLKENKELFLSYFDQDLSAFFDMRNIKSTLATAIDDLGSQEDYKLFKFFSFAIWHKVFKEKHG